MRLFVDMDGTLAVFTPVDTLETLYEPGYFASLKPHMEVIDGLKVFMEENPDIEVSILSSVLEDSKYALSEKQAWLDHYLPEIDREHRFFPACGAEKTTAIPGGVRTTDILLDDYSKNLHDWEPPAIGIKLMNGINGTKGTWTGCKIDYSLAPSAFAKELRSNILSAAAEKEVKYMRIRKIENGNSSFTVLSEIEKENGKQDLLLVRDSDREVIIAHGWNAEAGEWDSGHYYGSPLSALSKAASDFSEMEIDELILANHRELRERENSDKPVAFISPGYHNTHFIVQLDEASRNSIENAIRAVEIKEGYTGEELEELVRVAMSNRICDLEEDIHIKEKDLSWENAVIAKAYAQQRVESLQEDLKNGSGDIQAIQFELKHSAQPELDAAMEALDELEKEHPELKQDLPWEELKRVVSGRSLADSKKELKNGERKHQKKKEIDMEME